MFRIGVIGLGERMSGMVKLLIQSGECVLTAVADPRIEEVKREQTAKGTDISKTRFYENAEEMLSSEELDGVLVGTRCSLHTKYACLVISKGLPLYLEKPVSTTREDLSRLEELLVKYPERCRCVTVSFPLRFTEQVLRVKEIINSGKIGEIAHVQAWCNVPYAVGYYHKWYRDDKETGGLFLQKATHDVDYIMDICGKNPTLCCAMTSKKVFKGDHPAGLLCRSCAEKDTCIDYTADKGTDYRKHDFCCFGVDTGNEDSGSAVIMLENGVHISYSQDFISRKSAGRRGARFIGHLGTVEFDWHEGYAVFHNHYGEKEEIKLGGDGIGHFGGDFRLAADFISVLKGKDSACSLFDGVRSAKLCLCLRESAEKKKFVEF